MKDPLSIQQDPGEKKVNNFYVNPPVNGWTILQRLLCEKGFVGQNKSLYFVMI